MSLMSDPPVDLEKGVTVPKEEEQEERAAKPWILDVFLVLYWVVFIYVVLVVYIQYDIQLLWMIALTMLPCMIFATWKFRQWKKAIIQRTELVRADDDLSTTLLASTKK